MQTPKSVLIAGERHLIIIGQIGNLQAKIKQLAEALRRGQGEQFIPYLDELEVELEYLRKYYPQLDGSISYSPKPGEWKREETSSPLIDQSRKDAKIRHALRHMRLLMDLAAVAYQYDGALDCHLKVMLDESWNAIALEVGDGGIDDIPF